MAIITSIPGLSASILSRGQPLPEYDDDDEAPAAPGTVTKYIESREGEYEVRVDFGSAFNFDCPTIWATYRVDGKKAADYVWPRSFHYGQSKLVVKGPAVGTTGSTQMDRVKPFRFERIALTTDDDKMKDAKKDSETVGKAGIIVVELYRASQTAPVAWNGFQDVPGGSGALKVHEKALKGSAKSHTTSFGPAVAASYTRMNCTKETIDPFAVFSFKYHDRRSLESLLVIRRPPSPENDPLNVANLNAEQRQQLEQFARNLRDGSAGDARVKREGERGPIIKAESSRKRGSSGKIKVVDLTGSDDEDTHTVSSAKKRKSGGRVMLDLTDERGEENYNGESSRSRDRESEDIKTLDLTAEDEED